MCLARYSIRLFGLTALCLMGTASSLALVAPVSVSEVALVSIDEVQDPFEVESFERQLEKIAKLGKVNEEKFWEDLQASIQATDAPQLALVAGVLADFSADRSTLGHVRDFGAFDPAVYPPGPKRKAVKEGTGTWKRVAKDLVSSAPERGLPEHYRYDFATGEIVTLEVGKTKKERSLLALDSALRGYPLDQDLAEAILLSRLDERRPFAKEADYFAHDYADLKAKAYSGISLYDVWSHQIPLDVPNVDLRAYTELVSDTKLPVKVSEKIKGDWYPRMSKSLYDYRSHRQAAQGTAALYFESTPDVPGGWVASANVMHAFCASLGVGKAQGPGALINAFHEKGPDIASFALEGIKAKGNDAWDAGNSRRDDLAEGRKNIRAAAIAAIERALINKND
jgi:hypothetical protein